MSDQPTDNDIPWWMKRDANPDCGRCKGRGVYQFDSDGWGQCPCTLQEAQS